MSSLRRGLLVIGAGLAFGTTVSLMNSVTWPGLQWISLIIGVGWAWCAFGVLVGSRCRTWWTALLAGTATLSAAVIAYYATDFLLGRYGPHLDWLRWDVRAYLTSALIAGPVLGLVGYLARRTDAIGLLAKAVVPALAIIGSQQVLGYHGLMSRVAIAVIACSTVALVVLTAQLVNGLRDPGRRARSDRDHDLDQDRDQVPV